MKNQALFISLIITMSSSSQVLIDPCMDLENIDFGFCDMAMGIGVVGGECVFISGCGWVVEGIDYSPAFYPDFESCELCLQGGGEGCTYSVALNYNPNATLDNGTCVFPDCMSNCTGDITGDDMVSVEDVLDVLSNFGAICE